MAEWLADLLVDQLGLLAGLSAVSWAVHLALPKEHLLGLQ